MMSRKLRWSAMALVVAAAVLGSMARADDKKLTVAFSQIGAESEWRKANTESIKGEAEKRGITLNFSDAQQKKENQISALQSFIPQHPDVIAFSPVIEDGWQNVLKDIKDAGIPVILTDRRVNVTDSSLYVTFIGSDFKEEGRRAGRWLAYATKGDGVIAELVGTTGSAPANDRAAGFREVVNDKKTPNMKILLSQTGDFTMSKGKQVMEAWLKQPDGAKITCVFAHNDDMALGAIQAIEEAGKKPGVDIKIVSIDGVHGAFEALGAGKLNCTVECNPLIGPQLFEAAEKVAKGEKVPKRIVVKESGYAVKAAGEETPAIEGVQFLTQDQAKAMLKERKY